MKKLGFTIVELIVTVAVIGILASITIVAYNGAQAQARDADRISDLHEIADAIKLYRTKAGHDVQTVGGVKADCGRYENPPTNTIPMGGGSSNAGAGWFNYETTSTTNYSVSVLHCLTFKGYLNDSFVDPTGCASTTGTAAPGYTCTKTGYAYMKYTCTYNGDTISIIYARLETKDESSKLTSFDGGANTCSSNTVAASPYFMNYMVIAD